MDTCHTDTLCVDLREAKWKWQDIRDSTATAAGNDEKKLFATEGGWGGQ